MRARDLTGGGSTVAQDEGPAAEAEHSACLLRTVVAPRGGLNDSLQGARQGTTPSGGISPRKTPQDLMIGANLAFGEVGPRLMRRPSMSRRPYLRLICS